MSGAQTVHHCFKVLAGLSKTLVLYRGLFYSDVIKRTFLARALPDGVHYTRATHGELGGHLTPAPARTQHDWVTST